MEVSRGICIYGMLQLMTEINLLYTMFKAEFFSLRRHNEKQDDPR